SLLSLRISGADAAPVEGQRGVGAGRDPDLVDQAELVVGVGDAEIARTVTDGGDAGGGEETAVLDRAEPGDGGRPLVRGVTGGPLVRGGHRRGDIGGGRPGVV